MKSDKKIKIYGYSVLKIANDKYYFPLKIKNIHFFLNIYFAMWLKLLAFLYFYNSKEKNIIKDC
ncbi:hypothetical protein PFNF135_06052 [Plasmodium falciparum NF135/5.C10]|uniref:Uncharacterized protein n=1 Tax=Plasmodium falciparum NF135/5.C10 TaxID=1036726 RepID=W4I8K6_PLAFA|nr:hypothetical protein PFNF135_06052 [Plasmodium falciparum NF135/5.C10]